MKHLVNQTENPIAWYHYRTHHVPSHIGSCGLCGLLYSLKVHYNC